MKNTQTLTPPRILFVCLCVSTCSCVLPGAVRTAVVTRWQVDGAFAVCAARVCYCRLHVLCSMLRRAYYSFIGARWTMVLRL
jgi:hypothetical protein